MGCCISKCKPDNNDKNSPQEYHFKHQVQDKLVISQASSPYPIPYNSSKKISPSPPSPTSSVSSISSFTCTTSSNTISSTSSLSSASSSLSSKDRSFSNEFLWSCYKDNPHIIHINSLREATHSLCPTKPKPHSRKINGSPSPAKPCLAPTKQSPPQKVAATSFSIPQKRVRSNSPTNLTRQKSFRKETERPNCRTLGSPSPSRRFSGDKFGSASAFLSNAIATNNSLSSKRMTGSKLKAAYSHSVPSMNHECVKPASPKNNDSGLRHRETCTYRVGSKIDETVVKDVLSNYQDVDDSALMDDIDNPLISLDCFIFL